MAYAADVNYRCSDYQNQTYDWQTANDVFKGTRHMRDMGLTYLPREPAESYRAYTIRRNKAVLYNAFKQTVKGCAGMVFKRDPEQSTDIPAKLQDDFKDADLAGNKFSAFARTLFEHALRDGHTYVLIDYPEEDLNIISRADQEASGRRPNWIEYTKDQVISWRTEMRNNKTFLTQVVIEELVYEADGQWGENQVVQYRVLRPGSYELWRQAGYVGGSAFLRFKTGLTSLDYIPIVPIYTNKTGFFMSEPPLLDLVHLNIRHFQIYSDYAHILHVANVPILWFVGRRKDQSSQEIGPNAAIDLDDGGQMGFAEHGGGAIGGARTEIIDLEQRMALLGLQLTAPTEGKAVQTATTSVINKSSQMSILSIMAGSFKDGLEKAMDIHADYYGYPDGGTANIIKDFDRLTLDVQMLTMLETMIKDNNLDVETLWAMMEQADILPDEFDAKKVAENIKKRRQEDLDFAVVKMNKVNTAAKNTGQPPTPSKPPNPRTGPESFGQGAGAGA